MTPTREDSLARSCPPNVPNDWQEESYSKRSAGGLSLGLCCRRGAAKEDYGPFAEIWSYPRAYSMWTPFVLASVTAVCARYERAPTLGEAVSARALFRQICRICAGCARADDRSAQCQNALALPEISFETQKPMSEDAKGQDLSQGKPALNEFQMRHLRVSCEYLDTMLSDFEQVLHSASSKAAFPKYLLDINPTQRRTLEDYIARIRAQLLRVLDGQGIHERPSLISARHALHVNLTFMDITVEELLPRYMRGYGEVPESIARELNGIVGELKGLVAQFGRYLVSDTGEEFKARLERLGRTQEEFELLSKIDRAITDCGLVEFRPTIASVLDRAEENTFEIAIFGRVSSGKSSLLNGMLGTDVLPVGVTPITSVPTRIRSSKVSQIVVSFAERPTQRLAVDQLREFVTEQQNPGNTKRVTRIILELPAERLQTGVTFVDTPGLGSLATSGAAETLAYLPRCDLGVVLIDAASTLTPDDLRTIQALQEATIPVTVLLSKSDLLASHDLERVITYVREHVASECHLETAVHPVSVVASHRQLLDQWFQDDIRPLFARSLELKAISLRRKIGALRDSVVFALCSRLRLNQKGSTVTQSLARAAEARLREATGQFEEVRSHCEAEAELMARAEEITIGAAAERIQAAWSSRVRGQSSDSEVVQQAVRGCVEEWTRNHRQQVEALASQAESTLTTTAKELELADIPPKDDLVSVIREMPPYDPPPVSAKLRWPALATLFGKGAAKNRLAAQIRAQCGNQIHQSLEVYAGLWKAWLSITFAKLKARFEEHANRYRAQAERLFRGSNLSEEEERNSRQALSMLEETLKAAETSSRQETPSGQAASRAL